MKWMIGTPLPASGLKPHERVICTEEVNSTVIAIVDKEHAPLISASPELLESVKVILDGFEKGVFVRDVTRDIESSWALRLIPFIKALADAQRAVLKAEAI